MNNSDLMFERPENVDQPSNFFLEYIDQLTNGAWSVSLPVMVFALVYLGLNDYNPRQAYGAASFATLITTVMLLGLGVMSSEALIIAILLVVLAVVLNGGQN